MNLDVYEVRRVTKAARDKFARQQERYVKRYIKKLTREIKKCAQYGSYCLSGDVKDDLSKLTGGNVAKVFGYFRGKGFKVGVAEERYSIRW